jgi:iron(III) transport system ATP-binding protein
MTVIGPAHAGGLPEGSAAEVLLRPEGLRVLPEGARNATPAEVEACRLLGSTTLVHMTVEDGEGGVLHLHARLPPGAVLVRGQRVAVALDPSRAFAFAPGATPALSA